MNSAIVTSVLVFCALSSTITAAPDCPFGLSFVFCFIPPCQFATCDGMQTGATCHASQCGGCFDIWTDDETEQIISPQVCDCPNSSACFLPTCPSSCGSGDSYLDANATCFERDCNGCSHRWYVEYDGEFFDVTAKCPGP